MLLLLASGLSGCVINCPYCPPYEPDDDPADVADPDTAGRDTAPRDSADRDTADRDTADRDTGERIVRPSCLDILDAAPATPSGIQTILLDGVETAVYCDMTTAGGGWTQVGRVAGMGAWIAGDGLLEGETAVGAADTTSPLEGDSFMIAFHSLPDGDLLFAAGDGSAWGVLGRDAVGTPNEDLVAQYALVKSSSGTPLGPGEFTNVLFRANAEDPWIGFSGTHVDNEPQMFYGENGYDANNTFKNEHGGINIFLRAYCMGRGTLISPGRGCVCEDGHGGLMCEGPPDSAPPWVEGDEDGAYMGASVAAAGDIDGDGFDDVLVGAPYADHGETDEGRAYLFSGSATGVTTDPSWTAESNQSQALAGSPVASAGDVDGDGLLDVIVASPWSDGALGSVSVYANSSAGLSSEPAWTMTESGSLQFGGSVSAAGDINADGYGDVIIGASGYANGQLAEGAAFLYYGSETGLAEDAAWQTESDQAEAGLGAFVAGAGDVDADGIADVLLSAPNYDDAETDAGQVQLYLGSAGGLSATPDWTVESGQASSSLATAAAGDVNADGYDDVLVGAYLYDDTLTDEGRAWLYLGSASGPEPDAAWWADGGEQVAWFGAFLSSAGDMDADGYGDVIVAAPAFDDLEVSGGAVFVYFGTSEGLEPVFGWTAAGDQTEEYFGWAVSPAGDVDADGFGDVLVGAIKYDDGQIDEGRAFLFSGPGR